MAGLALDPLYEVANNLAYNTITNLGTFDATTLTSPEMQNRLVNTMINGITLTALEQTNSNRGYDRYQIPATPFGAIVEQLGTKLIRPDDPVSLAPGTSWTDFVRPPQNFIANYVGAIVDSVFPLSVDMIAVQELASTGDARGVARFYAKAYHTLWESIKHENDLLVPFLLGWLASHQKNDWVTIPEMPTVSSPATDILSWGIQTVAQINATIRNMTTFRNPKYNVLGADSIADPQNLAVIAFYDPSDNTVSPADVLEAYIGLAAQPNVNNIQQLFKVGAFYQMPLIGNIKMSTDGTAANLIPRANGITSLPGMQTTDMSGATPMFPVQSIKFAVVQDGAINAGHKHLLPLTGLSARAGVQMTWVRNRRQIWGLGPFQSAFFTDGTTNAGGLPGTPTAPWATDGATN